MSSAFEVIDRQSAPYSSICYVQVTWPDGTASRASGVIVGYNDILTALHVLERMAVTARSLQSLAGVVTRLPQVLVNVPGVDKSRADEDAVLAAAVAEEEAVLGERGRILLRPSGTEPIVRVMVEAPTEDEAQGVASRLADVVRTQLTLP